MKYALIEGQYELIEEYAKYAIPGMFPRRYWDIVPYEDDADLAEYLREHSSSPVPRKRAERFSYPFGQEDRDRRRQHTCARCQRPCKPQYEYCFRCNQYLKVKRKLAS